MMVGYLEITPPTALIVLGEILTSFGIEVGEPNIRRIEKKLKLRGKTSTKTTQRFPMVSIPIQPGNLIVGGENRETSSKTVTKNSAPKAIFRVPKCSAKQCIPAMKPTTSAASASSTAEYNKELTFLSSTLSLNMLEAEFLRMHLKSFNLKVSSVLELLQCCEDSNCHCPDIRKRATEQVILVRRADN